MRATHPLTPIMAVLLTGVLLTGVLAAAAKAQQPPDMMPSITDEQMIASALSAAPPAATREATVMAIEADGTTRMLRTGTNGFTCLPDNPDTPGPDPMCADRNAMEWTGAWLENRVPPADKVGVIYMLAGNSDPSGTDPQATEPAPGSDWVVTGPLIIIIGASKMMEGYPNSSPPDTTMPYIMWAGTPFEHAVIPIK
jgi:hypothetical protein